jgi:hypothetical protein
MNSAQCDGMQHPVQTAPLYFSVSIPKLIIMSLCSLGIYELYWSYRNWKLVQSRALNQWDAKISPFWRAVWSLFYLYSLLKLVKKSMHVHNVAGFLSPGWLTFGFIILTICYRLPDPYWLVSFLSVIPLTIVQQRVNSINAIVAPTGEINSQFSGWNVACIVVGGGTFLLAIIGTFID